MAQRDRQGATCGSPASHRFSTTSPYLCTTPCGSEPWRRSLRRWAKRMAWRVRSCCHCCSIDSALALDKHRAVRAGSLGGFGHPMTLFRSERISQSSRLVDAERRCALQFRSERISQSSRLRRPGSPALLSFRSERISQSSRLTGSGWIRNVSFRSERISQSSRLDELGYTSRFEFRSERISQSSRL